MLPTISIITVTYNSKPLLETTILNILGQSYKNYEYIIIDGNSNDGSQELIKKHKKQISYWSSEPDNGIYDAMNKGLKAAKGKYTLFLNAGDTFYETTTLEKIPFDKYPNADIFYGETMIVDETRQELGLRQKKLPYNLTWQHFKNGMVVCHQSIIIRKEIAPLYNMDYKLSADVEWVLKCLKKSKETVFTHSIIANFIEGGASVQRHSESLRERFQIMNKYFGLLTTLFAHFKFIVAGILRKAGILKKFRKNNLSKTAQIKR